MVELAVLDLVSLIGCVENFGVTCGIFLSKSNMDSSEEAKIRKVPDSSLLPGNFESETNAIRTASTANPFGSKRWFLSVPE